ncbi:MAG TPA: DUF1259 domain-containing protein [Polyangia bacterium]|nr:DUF1259 domain-containing protein [Polyangia bacterium]
MRTAIAVIVTAVCLFPLDARRALAAPPKALPDAARIEELTGLKGKMDEKAGVFRLTAPRSDLKVTTAGVRMTPPLGLTAWIAFQRVGTHTVVMGDTVMTEDQVNPVMSVALDQGLEVTALHNHFFWDSPKVMFMHIGGMGDEEKLARAVGAVFAKIAATSGGKGETPRADVDPAKSTLDAKALDAVFAGHGAPGDYKDGVYKIVVGRGAKMAGHAMGKAMGVNTWAAMAGSAERAVIDGDIAMLESELQPVLKTLRGHDINVVALHHHMAGEQPRILFLHYWGTGKAADLAAAVVAALQATKHDGAP